MTHTGTIYATYTLLNNAIVHALWLMIRKPSKANEQAFNLASDAMVAFKRESSI